jgi:hypothetical protein
VPGFGIDIFPFLVIFVKGSTLVLWNDAPGAIPTSKPVVKSIPATGFKIIVVRNDFRVKKLLYEI